MSTMTRGLRTPFVTAITAAAIAALLAACAKTDPTPTARADETKQAPAAAEANATEAMPEVVIVASRERPGSRS